MTETSTMTMNEAERFTMEVFGYERPSSVIERYGIQDPNDARWFAMGIMAAYEHAGRDAIPPRVKIAVAKKFMDAVPGDWLR